VLSVALFLVPACLGAWWWQTSKAMIDHALQFRKHHQTLMRSGATPAVMPDQA
jgi:hypothetical protein